MKTKIPHHCPEWDFLWIYPEAPEWQCCHCEEGEECLNLEDALVDLEESLEINPSFHQTQQLE